MMEKRELSIFLHLKKKKKKQEQTLFRKALRGKDLRGGLP